MKVTRTFISAATAATVLLGGTAPAFAYRTDATPPVATTQLRQRAQLRELYADAYPSILAISTQQRSAAVHDTTGRSFLARAQVRAAQRNFRRHVLGYLRGVDYRVLNLSSTGRDRYVTAGERNLPDTLVTTGGSPSYDSSYGDWGWDRPTRRDIRKNNRYLVTDRDRDLLEEMKNNEQ